MRHWTWCDINLQIPILTSAPPRLILVLSGQYHMLNASIVNNCRLSNVGVPSIIIKCWESHQNYSKWILCHNKIYFETLLPRKLVQPAYWERSGPVLDSRQRGRGFEPRLHHCVVSLSKNINPSLELVQPRKCPLITERLLMGRKESNQTTSIYTYLFCLL